MTVPRCSPECSAALDAIEAQLHEMRSLKGWRLNLIRENLAKAKAALLSLAQTPSPVINRNSPAPDPCGDLDINRLIEWLDSPQYTNGYLDHEAANHMSAAAELLDKLFPEVSPVPSIPGEPAQGRGEPHEATYLRGWNEAIEECIKAAATVMRIEPRSAGGPLFEALRALCSVSSTDKAYDPAFVEEIKRADAAAPEAAFDNSKDMLDYLNDTVVTSKQGDTP